MAEKKAPATVKSWFINEVNRLRQSTKSEDVTLHLTKGNQRLRILHLVMC